MDIIRKIPATQRSAGIVHEVRARSEGFLPSRSLVLWAARFIHRQKSSALAKFQIFPSYIPLLGKKQDVIRGRGAELFTHALTV